MSLQISTSQGRNSAWVLVCYLTQTQLDLLKSLVFLPAPLTSSLLHRGFYFEILGFHFIAGMLIFSNLHVFSWLNWRQVTDVSLFFPVSYRKRLLLAVFHRTGKRA